MTANDKQVGGQHYKGSTFQHWDLIDQHGIGYLEGCATKYVSRWRKKNGEEDLQKALHYVEKLMETSRPPQGHAPAREIADFCDMNGLDDIESHIMQCLCGPHTYARLADARDGIQVLIKQARELAANY